MVTSSRERQQHEEIKQLKEEVAKMRGDSNHPVPDVGEPAPTY
jgi:hypothetical protein